jgi:DNA replication protein DnaC
VTHKKPLMIASNYSPSELAQVMTKLVQDPIKIERIMERIRTLSRVFELRGKNYRNM